MKRLIFLLIFITISLSANATSRFSGQKEYLDECRVCHHGSNVFLSKYTLSHWHELLDNDGKLLVEVHEKIKNPDKKNIQEYFKSCKYQNKVKHLKDFIEHYLQKSMKTPIEN